MEASWPDAPCMREGGAKVTDVNQFADYGVMLTPALVIDNQVKLSGRVATKKEIKEWLSQAR